MYDLETESTLYCIGNGVVSSNCRCSTSYTLTDEYETLLREHGPPSGDVTPGPLGPDPETTPKPTPKPKPKPKPTPKPKPKPEPAPKPTLWEPAETMAEAVEWGKKHGVYVVPDMPKRVTLAELNAVNRELAKAPQATIDTTARAGYQMDVIAGKAITSHPGYAHMKGFRPRGYPEGTTYDEIPGIGGEKTVIVANRMKRGEHGSVNLVLHEHAHTYDAAVHTLTGQAASASEEWRKIHAEAPWGTAYLADYPEEGFAETFARYFDSTETRERIPQVVQSYWKKVFGS